MWAIQAILFELFAMSVRYIPMRQNAQKQKKLNAYLKIQKAFDLVHEEYFEDITIECVASYVGYDPRSFW